MGSTLHRNAGEERAGSEPRWPAILAIFAVGSLWLVLPDQISFGPRWLLLLIVALFTVAATLAQRAGHHGLNQRLAYIGNGLEMCIRDRRERANASISPGRSRERRSV